MFNLVEILPKTKCIYIKEKKNIFPYFYKITRFVCVCWHCPLLKTNTHLRFTNVKVKIITATALIAKETFSLRLHCQQTTVINNITFFFFFFKELYYKLIMLENCKCHLTIYIINDTKSIFWISGPHSLFLICILRFTTFYTTTR